MGSEREVVQVKDIAHKVASGPFGSNLRGHEYADRGVPVIRGNNLAGPRFTSSGYVFVTETKANTLSSSVAHPLDVVFAARGTVGAVGIVPEGEHARYLLSSNLMKVSIDQGKASPLFVFYYFRSPFGQSEILSYVNTTGVPKIERAVESLRRFRIFLPPLAEQRAIAHILGALDDKIELNRRMNQTLEAMAQALFKSWFVDFEPFRDRGMQDSPLGEIPVGWEVKRLDEVARFVNGLALQRYPPAGEDYLPVIKIAELRRGVTESSGKASSYIDNEYIIEDGDVLFSWSGSLEVCIWCGGRGALNQHLFKVTSACYPKWFYYFWIKYHLPEFQAIASGKATTMGHIQRYHLSNAFVAVPPREELDQLDKLITPTVEDMVANSLQSRTIAQVRDHLLPRLLSGEIRVKDAEKSIGEGA